jgi:hypothetical protein
MFNFQHRYYLMCKKNSHTIYYKIKIFVLSVVNISSAVKFDMGLLSWNTFANFAKRYREKFHKFHWLKLTHVFQIHPV